MTHAKKFLIAILAALPLAFIAYRVAFRQGDSVVFENELQQIAHLNDWRIDNVKLRERIWRGFETGESISESDWAAMVSAVDEESNEFLVSVALVMARSRIDESKKVKLREWAERLMTQTNSSDLAAMGYFSYIRSEGVDREVWKNLLLARGTNYVEKLRQQEEIAARVEKKLGMK